MNFVWDRKWYYTVVIMVGVIENDKVGVVKKHRDNLMCKSVKSSAIFHLLCSVHFTDFLYYSSNIDSFPEMGQISALIFPNFWIKELEAEHHLKAPPSPLSLDVMERFWIWVSACVHKSWTFPSEVFVKYLMKFSLENKLLAYQTMLEKNIYSLVRDKCCQILYYKIQLFIN